MSGSAITALLFIALGLWGKFFLGRSRFVILIAGGALLLAWEIIDYLRKKFLARKDEPKPPESSDPSSSNP